MLKKLKSATAISKNATVEETRSNNRNNARDSSYMSANTGEPNITIIKTEPIDIEVLNIERQDGPKFQVASETATHIIETSDTKSPDQSQPVQIQTILARQPGKGLYSTGSSAHKIILAPRLEYLQSSLPDNGVQNKVESSCAAQSLSEQQCLLPNSAITNVVRRVTRSPQTNSISFLGGTVDSSRVIITKSLPVTSISDEVHSNMHSSHIQRRHSSSPSHYQCGGFENFGGSHISPSASTLSLPPQQSSSSPQKQHVRVIRDGRLCEESGQRLSMSPPPLLHHHSRSAPASPVFARRYSVSPHETAQHITTDTQQHNILGNKPNIASLTVQYQKHAPPSSSLVSPSSTLSPSMTTTINQQQKFDITPTRKTIVSTQHINVISVNTIQGQHNNCTSPPQFSLHQHQLNISAATTTSISPASSSVPVTTLGPSTSTTASRHVFRTPVVSSSSSCNLSNNIGNTAMRPPPPPPPPKSKNVASCPSKSIPLGMGNSNNCKSGYVTASSNASNSNPEEPTSSIPDLEFDGTTVLCRVCGDKASGFHYGVHSCEGCKGFFRRSIQQKIQYRPCTKNQQCSILRINRNRCQYCRLKKCIAVGMSRDAVRFGRVPKREKARILAAMQQSTQNRGQQRALATELDDEPRLLAAVLRAHLETCEFTKEKVAAMRQRARECPSYSMPTLLACPLNPAPELQSEQEFSQRFAHVIRGVIDFAGMIPGFQLLTQDDKFTLLKAGLFDALFVRLICMFDSSINSIICLNGQVMRRDAIQNGANARFLVDSTFNFAERMNSMNLSDAEIGLFCAIVLITPDRPGLRNIELIEKMYTRLKSCLQKIVNQNRPDQPDFMAKLLDTMPDLRTLSTLHTEKLVVFRTEHKELLRQQMWSIDDEQPPSIKSPVSNWEDTRMEVEAKSPLGSVSSTESRDLEYGTSSSIAGAPQSHHHHKPHTSTCSLASSAPLLAATLSGSCPLRNRANSGSSGDSTADLDIVGSHAHLTQNGLTITPIIRSHSHQQLHHHLTGGSQHRYRKLDSPTDSGIESGNEKNECGNKPVSSGGSSSCSSPRSSVDEAMECGDATQASSNRMAVSVSPVRSPQPTAPTSTSATVTSMSNSPSSLKRQIIEDMPVLKRVLQAPPLYDTNSLMDEAYKPHKKFRALRHREFDTAEADACSTSSMNIVSNNQQTVSNNSPPSAQITGVATTSMVVTQKHTPLTSTSPIPPPSAVHQQSQLHMHLTRQTPTNTNGICTNQHQQASSLSSTHSVLAKSLMAEPRMTPEQMKRSDIIQNYIMRDPAASSCTTTTTILSVSTPNGQGSKSPSTVQHITSLPHHGATIGSGSPAPSTSPIYSNTNCASPSTSTVTLTSSPSTSGTAAVSARWQGHSVITTTSINQRQQSVSPSSNGSSSSLSSSSSNGCQYFQSPHSTSASISPPRTSPSALHSPPRLIELQVDIADSQQPLNLSKKSPTPPPNKLQALVAAASAAQRFPAVSADVTVTAANAPPPSGTASPSKSNQQLTVHKVMLEA